MQVDQFVELAAGGLAIGAIYGLIGLGFSMIMRATGIIHFAQGEVMMLGALAGWSAASLFSIHFIIVLLVGIVFGSLAALVMYLLVYRALGRWGVPLNNVIIATIGMSILAQNVAMLVWGTEPHAYPKLFVSSDYAVGSAHVSPQQLWIIGLGLGLVILLQSFLRWTRTGIALQAVAQDPEAAQLMGINLTRSISLTFAIGGAMAGAAGVLLGSLFFASFTMGFVTGIKAFVAATLGGLGSIGGALVGGLVFGLIETFSAQWISNSYRDAVGMVLLILILLAMPQGLVGLLRRR
jgi:branched-subunit amino acid ABC-type transport system permease component